MTRSNGQSSTMVRRQLGRRLRVLRLAAGKTQEDVASTRLMSLAKLKTIEAGRSMVRPGDVYELGRLYDADLEVVDQLRELAVASVQGGWWQEFGHGKSGSLKGFETFLDLEASASKLSIFQPLIVYGLFQTETYAHAVNVPDPIEPASEAAAERSVRLRLQRLPRLLTRDAPPQITAVLGEPALHQMVGDAQVMSEQMDRLRELNSVQNLSINVLPYSAGAHRGVLGPFTILDFDDAADPSVMFVETYSGSRYEDHETVVARQHAIFEALHGQSVPLEDFLS